MIPSAFRPVALLAHVALFASGASAFGQDFSFQITSAASQADLTNDFTVNLPGDVIGDFDAATNPGGTSTLPGIFGGSGNQSAPLDMTLDATSDLSGMPTGSFDLSADTGAFTLDISGLDLDPLGGVAGAADLTLTLDFSTFRTFAPDSLYIGGIPLPLPLGMATVDNVRIVQSGPSLLGVLIGTLTPGQYDFVVTVPADLSFDFDLMGTLTPVAAPIVLPLMGTLTINGANAQVSIDVMQMDSQSIMDPLPGFTIDGIPLPLPTILPPGGVANLLYDATIDSLDINSTTTLLLVADGVPAAGCGATNFCTALNNSTGSGAMMSTNGNFSASANSFELICGPVPQQPGIFFWSEGQVNGGMGVAFGNGLRCVGGQGIQVYRLPFLQGTNGELRYTVDLASPPFNAVAITAGSTWNFQGWFRDPAGGGAGYNLSDGLEVTFCP